MIEVIIMLYQLLDAAGNIEKISTNIALAQLKWMKIVNQGQRRKIKLTNQRQSKLKPIGIRVISQEP